ncbi:MAG: hypothetical protein KIT14_11725 [bacterium]|nr:hypothetical protein [bacterium]
MASDDPASQLDALRLMLTSANDLTAGLLADPLVPRLLRAFGRLPEPDREPILRVLERDATWCRIAEQTVEVTGVTVRANPQASLYLHVLESPPTEPLQRDVDVIAFGMMQFVHLLPLFFQDGVHAQWTAAARVLAANASEDTIANVRRIATEVLALVEEPRSPS